MDILEQRIKEAVSFIYLLKTDNNILKEKLEKVNKDIKFLERENEKAKRIIKEAEMLNQLRKEIREKAMNLLEMIEKCKI